MNIKIPKDNCRTCEMFHFSQVGVPICELFNEELEWYKGDIEGLTVKVLIKCQQCLNKEPVEITYED